MEAVRRQLSLFVPAGQAEALEAARRVLDPVQHRLIPAHVTLCRDEETAALDLSALAAILRDATPLRLRFGAPESFWEHGVVLPCIAGEDAFFALRGRLVGESRARLQRPHMTLAHPRNPKAPGNTPDQIGSVRPGAEVCFDAVQYIEQSGGGPWQVLRTFALEG
jgi:hypothetical protein